ncbi:MAG: sigma-70 family RNA polymerase sigma factor [Oscillospiraceae bacterium]
MAKYNSEAEYLVHCPNLSEEICNFLRKSDRKMEYFESDLKQERRRKGKSGAPDTYLPSREDSLDRLLELDKQFNCDDNVQDRVEKAILIETMMHCLNQLPQAEHDLICAAFFAAQTQDVLAKKYGISQQAVSKKLKNALALLAKLMKI